MEKIIQDIIAERANQKELYSEKDDDAKTEEEWIGLIEDYLDSPRSFRFKMLVVAALCIAATESSERKG